MTYEEKRDLLEQYQTLNCYINQLINEKAHWYSVALNGSKNDVHVKRDLVTDKVDRAVDKVTLLENAIDEQIDTLVDMRNRICTEIDNLGDVRLRNIVYLKYIAGMTLEKAAEQTGYCTRQAMRLHKMAIDNMFNG